jgi:hypothetical protein
VALLWLGLLVAFSPVLANLLQHLEEEAWARYVLVFPFLLALCIARYPSRLRASALGYVALTLAILIELVAIGGSTMVWARPALPLAVIGLCGAFGLASTRTALLACWLIPVPHRVLRMLSPQLETCLLRPLTGLLDALGAELRLEDSRVLATGFELEVFDFDGGLTLAALLAGLGWYAGLRRGCGLFGTVGRAVLWGALALPIQLLALLALVLGAPSVGRFFLTPISSSTIPSWARRHSSSTRTSSPRTRTSMRSSCPSPRRHRSWLLAWQASGS